MTEFTIYIDDEKEQLIKELVKQLGGSVEEKKLSKKKPALNKEIKQAVKEVNAIKDNKKKIKAIDHTYLFGKWKNFDIDARKLRKESW